ILKPPPPSVAAATVSAVQQALARAGSHAPSGPYSGIGCTTVVLSCKTPRILRFDRAWHSMLATGAVATDAYATLYFTRFFAHCHRIAGPDPCQESRFVSRCSLFQCFPLPPTPPTLTKATRKRARLWSTPAAAATASPAITTHIRTI